MSDERLMPADWQRASEAGLSPGSPYSFLRVPLTRDLSKADVAVVGLPLDLGATRRPGARFGPLAIRNASMQLRPHGYDERSLLTPFRQLRIIDYGDIEAFPGYIEPSLERCAEALGAIASAGVFPIVLGGDHSVTLPALRALAKEHGRLSLVHFDAHPDCWPPVPERPYHHGTVFAIAAEEKLIDPAASVQIGIRGSLSSTLFELGLAQRSGFHIITADAFARTGVEKTLAALRRIARRPAYVSLDIDCVDPAFAPGTGTPEVAGLTSREIVELVRGLRDLPLVGFDVVEVSPPYDQSEITALLAANLVYEVLLLLAAKAAQKPPAKARPRRAGRP